MRAGVKKDMKQKEVGRTVRKMDLRGRQKVGDTAERERAGRRE